MNLIHFQGLNCYHDCVISIINSFGLDYFAAFASLWSETDFRYDPYRKTYLTKRMIANLETLGAKVKCSECFSQRDAYENVSLFYDGEFVIVGMDAFFIPWNQFYKIFHGPHYFIVQNTKTEMLPCFDPTYKIQNEQIARKELIEHSFDICRISRITGKFFHKKVVDEAHEIMRILPDLRTALLSRIHNAANGERRQTIQPAKFIDAMICNRYLYRVFLEKQSPTFAGLFLEDNDFLKWKAVKNGLYKASVSKNNNKIIDDLSGCLNDIIDKEIAVAQKLSLAFD